VNPRASYHLEDWGFLYEPSTHPLQKPAKKHFPVQTVQDWERITLRSATQGALGEQLDLVARVAKGAQGDPVLMTVFSPLSIAGDLVPDDQVILRHLQEHPQRVAGALAAITETFERFVAELLNAGADGVFFATTQWATRTRLSAGSYEAWGRPYDLRVLRAAQAAPFNLLHVCEAESLVTELSDYPAPLLNWGFEDAGNPDLASLQRATGKAVIGGVTRQKDLLESTPEQIFNQVTAVYSRMTDLPWGLGPDCAIDPRTPDEHLRAARHALAEVARGRNQPGGHGPNG
jgi:uroporphyrinogen decarboxylase